MNGSGEMRATIWCREERANKYGNIPQDPATTFLSNLETNMPMHILLSLVSLCAVSTAWYASNKIMQGRGDRQIWQYYVSSAPTLFDEFGNDYALCTCLVHMISLLVGTEYLLPQLNSLGDIGVTKLCREEKDL